MIPYLSLVFLMEVYLKWHPYIWPLKSTVIVYNFYRPLSVLFFACIYYSVPVMQRFKKVIIGIVAVYLFVTVLTHIFSTPISEPNIYLILARGFCNTLFAIFFLFSYFHLDNAALERHWRPLIWVTIGVVTFYPVISISLGFHEYLRDLDATFFDLKLYQAIPQLMSLIMYSCFSYAFYLCKKTN